jgi:WD40-like Beta Propeller Repeat
MRNAKGPFISELVTVSVLFLGLHCVGDPPVFPELDADTIGDAGSADDVEFGAADANVEPVDHVGEAPRPPSDGDTDIVNDTSKGHPCDPSAEFTIIEPVAELNGATDDEGPRLTPDELVMYLTRRAGQGQPFQIYTAKRASRDAEFGMPMPILLLANASGAMIAPDQTALYYSSDRGGADAFVHLYVARPPFSAATSAALAEVNSALSDDYAPYVSADDTELYLVSDRPSDADDNIFVAPRIDGRFMQPTAVTPVNSGAAERSPVLSADGLRLYFGSARARANDFDIYVARRSERHGTFEEPSPVRELNTTSFELPDWISPDDCTLYFRTDRPLGPGGRDIWRARRR